MNKTLAETLRLLLNNQKILAEQVSVLNEKIRLLESNGRPQTAKTPRTLKLIIDNANTDDEPSTFH